MINKKIRIYKLKNNNMKKVKLVHESLKPYIKEGLKTAAAKYLAGKAIKKGVDAISDKIKDSKESESESDNEELDLEI